MGYTNPTTCSAPFPCQFTFIVICFSIGAANIIVPNRATVCTKIYCHIVTYGFPTTTCRTKRCKTNTKVFTLPRCSAFRDWLKRRKIIGTIKVIQLLFSISCEIIYRVLL